MKNFVIGYTGRVTYYKCMYFVVVIVFIFAVIVVD